MQRIGLGVLCEEVPPERSGHQGGGVVAELVPRLLVPLRRVRLERPLGHLWIRTGRDVDTARGLLEDPGILERRRLDEVSLGDRREELLEPAILVYALVCTRPRAEFLAVVRVDDQACALIGARAKLLHRLADVPERDEVPELHAPREDDQRKALVLGDVRLAELLRAKPCLDEVLVVQDRVGNTRFSKERREVRLPDPLGQPRAQGALSEDRVNPIGKRPNLGNTVAPRHSDQDRLVVAA